MVAEVLLVISLNLLIQVILKIDLEETAEMVAAVVARAQEAMVLPQELEDQEARLQATEEVVEALLLILLLNHLTLERQVVQLVQILVAVEAVQIQTTLQVPVVVVVEL